MSEIKTFDCVVVGGGMVGAASALSLVQLGLTVALVEKYQPQAFSIEQPLDLRVSAISLASQYLLEQLDVWSQIMSWRSCQYQRLGVWESAFSSVEFNAKDIKQSHLGHIIENRLIQLAMWQQIKKQKNIHLFCPNSLQNYQQLEQSIKLELTDEIISTRLLIAADGANSQVRQLAGIGITGWDYQQSAMLINVKTQLPQQDITWQQFLPSGPVAMLPMPNHDITVTKNELTVSQQKIQFQGCASLVWYHQSDKIKQLMTLSNKQLEQEIDAVFPKRLGKIKVVNKGSFPLTRRHANYYQKGNVVLLGDAAHTINPLAGQGVNLGFKDVLALQTVVSEAIARNELWYSAEALQRYEKKRRTDNLLMMSVMDGFYTVFSHPSPVVKFLRNSALFTVNKFTPLKNKVLKQACGID
jgi:2-octaprenyl-3-methyl-6-methoxy-1,4-benzoquinol hydroxylase